MNRYEKLYLDESYFHFLQAEVWTPLPNIIFGVLALTAVVTTIFLPDIDNLESTEDEIALEMSDTRTTSISEDIPITNSVYAPTAAVIATDV